MSGTAGHGTESVFVALNTFFDLQNFKYEIVWKSRDGNAHSSQCEASTESDTPIKVAEVVDPAVVQGEMH